MSIQRINQQQPVFKNENKENEKRVVKEKPALKEIAKSKPTQNDLAAQLSQIDVRNIPETIAKENQSEKSWKNEPGVWDNIYTG